MADIFSMDQQVGDLAWDGVRVLIKFWADYNNVN
jgi:hypothetical protein